MKRFMLLITVCISNVLLAQNPSEFTEIDKKMDAIPRQQESSTTTIAQYISENFTTTEEQLRAAFYWTASSINYDLENINNQNPNLNASEKVAAAIQSRKGVCMHFAEVFKDIASKLDIEVLLIGGYNKVLGKVSPLSHQWGASKVNGKWYLFDPTWGGGYVMNGKYVKKITNKYFMADPKTLITTHMPFDYLWQFSEYPITNQEFYDGKTESANKTERFDFENEIIRHQKRSEAEQTKATIFRIEKNGLKNNLLRERLEFEKKKIENLKDKDSYYQLKDIIANFNKANALFNEFISFRNKKFQPLVSDDELKNKIQQPYDILLQCENDVKEVKEVSKENASGFQDLKKAISDSKKNFGEHLDFVNDYLTKDPSQRKKMFYTKTVRKRI